MSLGAFALLALLVVVPTPGGGATAGADLSPEEEERLEWGETVVRLSPLPGSRHSEGVAARVLSRSADRVWRAAADLDHWHEWVPFLEASNRVSGGAAAPAWRLRFDLPAPLGDRHYRVAIDVAGGSGAAAAGAGGRTVAWSSVPGSGNVAWARGSFAIVPRGPGRTLVVFRTATDTGDRTPGFLLDRVLRKSLPWVLGGLEQQVSRCRYTSPRPDGCREEPAFTP